MKSIRRAYFHAILGACLAVGAGAAVIVGTAAAQDSPAQASADEPFSMLNVLWFKEDGGEEKYMEYIAAATSFVQKHGGKAGDAYQVESSMIGEFDADLVFFVEWPNQAAFMGLIQDPGYQKISHLREEAITDSLLVRCSKL